MPFQPELGMGAIGEDGVRVINAEFVRRARVLADELAGVEVRERARLECRARRLRAAPAGPGQGEPGPGLLAPRRRPLIIVAGVAGAAVFAAVAGSFTRYSWPATAGVAGLATVVGIGWRGPLRPRPDPGKLPVPGAVLWAGPLAAGVWELVALSLQPSLTTTSYAHPAISTLTDPVLARRP